MAVDVSVFNKHIENVSQPIKQKLLKLPSYTNIHFLVDSRHSLNIHLQLLASHSMMEDVEDKDTYNESKKEFIKETISIKGYKWALQAST